MMKQLFRALTDNFLLIDADDHDCFDSDGGCGERL